MSQELAWFILAIIVVTMIANRFSAPKNLPPGPFPLPIIGNAHKMAGQAPYRALMAMEKHYGKVFRLYIGGKLTIVVGGAQALKEALVTKSTEFAGRPKTHTLDVYSRYAKTIAFADYSPQWRIHRKIVVSALRMYTSSLLKHGSIINEEVYLLLKRVQSSIGQTYDITKDVQLAVTNVICTMVFGSRYELNDPEFLKVVEITKGIVAMLGSGSVVDVFPWLKFFPFKSVQRYKKICEERDDLFGRIYREHVKANPVQEPRDLTDTLLKAKKEAEEEDSSVKDFFTDEHVILTMSEIFNAGLETTSSSVCWALLHLIHNPKIQDKLHQELDEVIGPNRLPELKDKKDLPHLEATITETLRLSGAPVAPRKSMVDTTLQGYHIPKDSTVLINLWSLHHDPDIWDAPNEFKPQRFLNEDGKFVLPNADHFHPFSAGRRQCLGESLARTELFLVLARLLHSFRFENPPGCDLPSLEPITGVTVMPKPFKVCPFKRHAN